MDHAGVIRLARTVASEAGVTEAEIDASNFLDFSNIVRDIVGDWSAARRAEPQTKEFALGLRKLRDDFLTIVEGDPMVLYKPAHRAALEFHQSQSRQRYFRAPNRTSKTQSGVADNYWVLTGQHPYRPKSPLPSAVAIVAVNFSKQAHAVYVPKLIDGEAGNPLSPAFPEGGKWFHSYDKRKYLLRVACRACAEAGKAMSCKHPKSTLHLFSDVEGPLVFAGGQYAQVQFDEQISYEFYAEALKRIETVPNSGLVITETPLGGKGFWTHKVLTKKVCLETNRKGVPLCSLHTIDQYEAGLTAKDLIDESKTAMTEQEAEARIYGRPAAYSKSAVFDNAQIGEMLNAAIDPIRGDLFIKYNEKPPGEEDPQHWDEQIDHTNAEELLVDSDDETAVRFLEQPDGMLRVWELPKRHYQYVIGADVAQGLTHGDASCAHVIKMGRVGTHYTFDIVASFHGWCNSLAYASHLMKLSMFYNQSWLVIERRGPGDATIEKLKELGCWTLFRDQTDPANAMFINDSRFGVDTNIKTKGIFISILQNVLWNRQLQHRFLNIPCRDTLEELGSYGQEVSRTGKTITFRGESGTPDDRVMALAVGVYAAMTFPMYDMESEMLRNRKRHQDDTSMSSDDRQMWADLKEENKQMMMELQGYHD